MPRPKHIKKYRSENAAVARVQKAKEDRRSWHNYANRERDGFAHSLLHSAPTSDFRAAVRAIVTLPGENELWSDRDATETDRCAPVLGRKTDPRVCVCSQLSLLNFDLYIIFN
jgi:hypothetical protein